LYVLAEQLTGKSFRLSQALGAATPSGSSRVSEFNFAPFGKPMVYFYHIRKTIISSSILGKFCQLSVYIFASFLNETDTPQ
jgi:hypothetical protein